MLVALFFYFYFYKIFIFKMLTMGHISDKLVS